MGTHQKPDWHVQVRSSAKHVNPIHEQFYSFTGLTQPQTKALAEKAHIYLTADGRISMAGLNGNNIDYFSESVSKVVKGSL